MNILKWIIQICHQMARSVATVKIFANQSHLIDQKLPELLVKLKYLVFFSSKTQCLRWTQPQWVPSWTTPMPATGGTPCCRSSLKVLTSIVVAITSIVVFTMIKVIFSIRGIFMQQNKSTPSSIFVLHLPPMQPSLDHDGGAGEEAGGVNFTVPSSPLSLSAN